MDVEDEDDAEVADAVLDDVERVSLATLGSFIAGEGWRRAPRRRGGVGVVDEIDN